MKHTKTYEFFDVVLVPFPFTDLGQEKRRPALIISSKEFFQKEIEHSVLAMITSAKNSSWPLDVDISDLEQAGLPAPSVVRMKLFTLDHTCIIRALGKLDAKDRIAVKKSLKKLFDF